MDRVGNGISQGGACISYQNCSSNREKLLKFEAEGQEFPNNSIFIQTVKGQNNFW